MEETKLRDNCAIYFVTRHFLFNIIRFFHNRMLNVSLVFRLDTMGDGNNNMRTVRLFGHPRLLRLPNRLQGQQLHEAIASLIPFNQPYKILLVDGQVSLFSQFLSILYILSDHHRQSIFVSYHINFFDQVGY